MWVVDTCVLIDLLRRDETFAALAADALDAKRTEGLTIAPLTYVELAQHLEVTFAHRIIFFLK